VYVLRSSAYLADRVDPSRSKANAGIDGGDVARRHAVGELSDAIRLEVGAVEERGDVARPRAHWLRVEILAAPPPAHQTTRRRYARVRHGVKKMGELADAKRRAPSGADGRPGRRPTSRSRLPGGDDPAAAGAAEHGRTRRRRAVGGAS
jgi:hypothetical protein